MMNILLKIIVCIIAMISDTYGKRESHFVTPQPGCETGTASTKDASDPNSFTNRCVNSTLNGEIIVGEMFI